MAAVSTAIHLLRAGDHVVWVTIFMAVPIDFFHDIMTRYGIEFTFLRLDDGEK